MKKELYLEIAPEVKSALESGKPVVALESTIISHGMPYPQNVQTARNVEEIIRTEGAIPATIAIIGGKFKVGLSADEIEYLGKQGHKVTKASRRDLPILAAKGMDGATTVASTMIIAAMAGIKIFATGGIGGVHRGAETTMDISADLEELGRTDVMVVCAGAKSILDIGLTLEYLETKGVPVIGYGTDELPAFYCRESGFGVDYRIDTPEELAAAMKAKLDLGIHGGMLVGNPVPAEYALSKGMADRAIDIAIKKANENGIKGKELTPFLLTLVKEMTGGMSLDANIELVYNNARVAAKTAVALSALEAQDSKDVENEEVNAILAAVADDTAESISHEMAAFRTEIENVINQRMAAIPMPNIYMNPFVNPYQQQIPNPYQAAPYQQSVQNPYQQMPYQQPTPSPYQPSPYQANPQPAPQPYVNPYKPVRPEPMVEPEPAPAPVPNPYKSVPDDQWVNPFAPKREKPVEEPMPAEQVPVEEENSGEEITVGGDAPVIAEPAEEVMEMVESSVGEVAPEIEEATMEETYSADESSSEGEKEDTLTEYVPPVHEKKERKPDNMVKQEMDVEGMTSYDPEFYRKRAEERKQRIAEAAGEAKHVEEAKAAEPEYIDCKGPLEFTGEHPWAWKCTRCGQIFQKHEIPHKCIKTD